MATDLSILDAFIARMESFSTSRPISWPGISFTPPSDGSGWIQFRFFPNDPNNLHYGSAAKQQYMGFVQASVVDPAGKGIRKGTIEAEAIQAHFPKGQAIGPVVVKAKPIIASALFIEEKKQTIIPVSIPYQGIAT